MKWNTPNFLYRAGAVKLTHLLFTTFPNLKLFSVYIFCFVLKVNNCVISADCQFWFNQELLRPDSNLHYTHDHAFSHRRAESNYRTVQLLSWNDSWCQVNTFFNKYKCDLFNVLWMLYFLSGRKCQNSFFSVSFLAALKIVNCKCWGKFNKLFTEDVYFIVLSVLN